MIVSLRVARNKFTIHKRLNHYVIKKKVKGLFIVEIVLSLSS